jgi:tRNA pseudouridine32 synthase/23S rRNA pseudouridine746 synthase
MGMKRGEKISVNAPLPPRDGVAASKVFMPQGTWPSLLAFLLDRFKYMPADVLRNRLADGGIVDEAGVAQTLTSPYQPLRWLWYYREVPDETPVPFDLPVLYRDAHLVVVDKPHFLPSIPAGRHLRETALTRLRDQLDLPQLSPIHRLDRDTAGVMLFCVDQASRGAYQVLFQSRRVNKEYEAVAAVRADLRLPLVRRSRIEAMSPGFMVREVGGSPNSETHIELIERRGDLGRYRLRPHTGRKHQLRLHMSALGIPVCNDRFYPELQPYRDADDFSDPLQLLARSIEFDDPFSGRRRRFESLRQLSAW